MKPLKSQNEGPAASVRFHGQYLSTFPAINHARSGARIKDLVADGWRFVAKTEERGFRLVPIWTGSSRELVAGGPSLLLHENASSQD
jgi:hypothetical protein